MPNIICIDPGHGGYDPGAVGKFKEKDFNLDVALDLKKALESRGITVVMTRTEDKAPKGAKEVVADLQARCDIADASGAALILSIHANGFPGIAHGAEAYVWPGGVASGVASSLVEALAPFVGVHGEAVKDGGPNGTNFKIIRGTKAPAVLLEIGFVVGDFDKLAKYLHQFGEILAVPLSKFLGGHAPAAPVVLPAGYVTEERLAAFRLELIKELKG